MGAKISSWIFFNITGETNKIGFGMLPGVADFLSELNSLNSGQCDLSEVRSLSEDNFLNPCLYMKDIKSSQQIKSAAERFKSDNLSLILI